MSIPGISNISASIILSETGNVEKFSIPTKILDFSGLEPSLHQLGKFTAFYSKMVKRGLNYLR